MRVDLLHGARGKDIMLSRNIGSISSEGETW